MTTTHLMLVSIKDLLQVVRTTLITTFPYDAHNYAKVN